jgi:hypothetical protein
MVIVMVVRLCPFCSWLTFIFGAKMADITLDTFRLDGKDQLPRQYQKMATYAWFLSVTFQLG